MTLTWEPKLPWAYPFVDFRGYMGYVPDLCYILTTYTYLDCGTGLRYKKNYKNEPTEDVISEFLKDARHCRKFYEARDFLAKAKR